MSVYAKTVVHGGGPWDGEAGGAVALSIRMYVCGCLGGVRDSCFYLHMHIDIYMRNPCGYVNVSYSDY